MKIKSGMSSQPVEIKQLESDLRELEKAVDELALVTERILAIVEAIPNRSRVYCLWIIAAGTVVNLALYFI